MPTLAGLIPVSTGVAFKMVAVLVPETVEDAALVARMVSELGLGRLAGAVYFPAEFMVPREPLAPPTDQVTAVFAVPVTMALNGYDSPARMLAVAGVTETLMMLCAGGGLAGAFVPETLPTQPEHMAANKSRREV